MDKKDALILRVLERSAKLSSRAVAREVGLPISTVHRRIKRLEQEGVITGYKALINYEKTDRPIGAYIFINLEEATPGRPRIPKRDIVDRLKKFNEVQELADVEGPIFNLVVKVQLHSLKELSMFTEELRSLEGIEELSTAIITEEIRQPVISHFST